MSDVVVQAEKRLTTKYGFGVGYKDGQVVTGVRLTEDGKLCKPRIARVTEEKRVVSI